MSGSLPIGGFFGLDLSDAPGGLRALWGLAERRWAYGNATSAFAALVAACAPRAVWLPAFLCAELVRAVSPAKRRYYGLDAGLSPDADALAGQLAEGDVVLAVNYFGRAPSAGWGAFVRDHRSVVFVEDCAQTVDTGAPPWGDWRLFSPRKIAGIPDGGILVPRREQVPALAPPEPVPPTIDHVLAALAPRLARMERPDENGLWHPMNQSAEGRHAITDVSMSEFSWRLMGLIDADALVARRRANFAVLAARLERWAVLEDPAPDHVPFGFPVRLPAERRDAVCAALHAERIFPAVHWRRLPAPRSFEREWEMAATFVTLPCDQRWSEEEMARLARAFEKAAG